MIWFLLAVLLLVLIVGMLSNKKYQSDDLLTGPRRNNSKLLDLNIPDPKEVTSTEFFDFLEKAKQSTIDDLHGKNYVEKFDDYILRNAFIYRWRYTKFDRQYYQDMIDRRNSPVKRKIRTSEEIYLDMLNNPREDGYFNTKIIEGYVLYNLFEITGLHIGNRYSIIEDATLDAEISLEKEDDNSHDKKAVKILIGKKKVGYVAATKTIDVRRIMSHPYKALLQNYDNTDGYVTASFALYMKKRK